MVKAVLLFVLLAFSQAVSAQCDLIIDYDASGNRIFRGNACDPDCSTHVVNTEDDGQGSLRRAIFCAVDGDNLSFDNQLFGNTIGLTSRGLVIDKSISLNWEMLGAANMPKITVEAAPGFLPLEVAQGKTVRIEDINFKARRAVSPRVLLNRGTLTLRDLDLIDDAAYEGMGSTILNQGILKINENVKIRFVTYN